MIFYLLLLGDDLIKIMRPHLFSELVQKICSQKQPVQKNLFKAHHLRRPDV